MMQLRDWISGAFGIFLTLFALSQMLGWVNLSFLSTITIYLMAVAGIILFQDGIVEVANSNILGWPTLFAALVVLIVTVLPILKGFGIGPSFFSFSWISSTLYNVIMIIEGIFLMISTFAREL